MGEESTRAVELPLEGHSLFISGRKYNFEPKLSLKEQRQISKLLTAPLLLAAVSIFFKTQAASEKNKPLKTVLNFSILFF